ncbi:MAG: hypothetical protein LBP56_09015 [Odoribacteraceae bacterium]|nr:hypothetical protein [Odoribacteraceae bacterium]
MTSELSGTRQRPLSRLPLTGETGGSHVPALLAGPVDGPFFASPFPRTLDRWRSPGLMFKERQRDMIDKTGEGFEMKKGEGKGTTANTTGLKNTRR